MAGDFGAALRRIANAVEANGAKAAAGAAGSKFIQLTLPHVPVRSGALRRSIRAKVSGGGLHAVAAVAPHTVYAQIQNDGGTIRVKHTYTTKGGKTLPGFLSDGDAFFGRSVVIKGQNYWTLAGKEAAIGQAAAQAIGDIIKGAA